MLVLRLPFRIAAAIVSECVVPLWLAAVLFVLPRLGIIAIAGLQQRVLIAMASLPCHRGVSRLIGAVLLNRSFTGIFIACFVVLCH